MGRKLFSLLFCIFKILHKNYLLHTEQIKVIFLFKRNIIVVCVHVRVGADEIRGPLAEQKPGLELSGSHPWLHSGVTCGVLELGSQAPPPELLV